MKIFSNDLILLLYLTLTTFCSTTLEDEKQLSLNNKFHQTQKQPIHPKKAKAYARIQRHNRQPNPPGLFGAISSLLGDTVIDTFTGYRNISRLVQTAFAPPKTTTGNTTMPMMNGTFTLRQALALLERNYRGLRRLFDNEFTKALNDSEKNVMDFRRELKSSARMFLEYGGANRL